jgi:hypothetical protein
VLPVPRARCPTRRQRRKSSSTVGVTKPARFASALDGLTWTAIGFLVLVAVLTFLSHDYSGASAAVLLAFVLVFLAARQGEDSNGE